MQRIVFFDIDGTLLDEHTKIIPSSTIEALKKAKDNNHILVVNTGRPYTGISPIIKNLPFDGYICGCGTHIVYHNKEIYHHILDEHERKKVIELNYQYDVDGLLEGKNGSFYKEPIKHPFINQIIEGYTKEDLSMNAYHLEDLPLFDKFTSWYTKDVNIEEYKENIKNDYLIIQRADDFIEVVPKSCSKAIGIQIVLDYLNMQIDQTISIGDSTNDLPMLTYTKESVAMGNSNPILFDQVTYITDDVMNNGIYNALKHYKLWED